MAITIDGEFTSTSATAEELLTKAVAPVELDPKLKKLYTEAFYTVNNKATEAGFRMDGFREAASKTLSVSMGLNNFFAFCRKALEQANILDDMPDSQVTAELQALAANIVQMNEEPSEDMVRHLLIALSTQRDTQSEDAEDSRFPKDMPFEDRPTANTIIKPSTRYKGGYDILFSGQYGRGGLKLHIKPFPVLPSRPSDARHLGMMQTNYSTPIAQRIMQAAQKICELVSMRSDKGVMSLENAHQRRLCQFPVDYNFKSWNNEISKIIGFPLNFFSNLDSSVTLYKSFLNVLVIIEQESELMQPWASWNSNQTRAQISGTESIEVPRPKNETLITPVVVFTPRVGGSISLSFERAIVNFMCQSETGDKALYCLSSWVTQWAGAFLKPKHAKGINYDPRRTAQYVIPPSRIQELAGYREKFGYHVSESKSDDDGLVIMPDGRFGYIPSPADSSNDNALAYEQAYEEMLSLSYELGLPAGSPAGASVTASNPEKLNVAGTTGLMADKNSKLKSMRGALIAFNWDYNTLLYASETDNLVPKDLNGCTPPDDLIMADFLGFDFKEPGEKSQKKHILTSLSEFRHDPDALHTLTNLNSILQIRKLAPELNIPEERKKLVDAPIYLRVFLNQRLIKLFETYSFYAKEGVVPNIAQLIEETKKEKNYTSFTLEGTPLDFDLYSNLIPDTIDGSSLLADHLYGQGYVVMAFLLKALADAEGTAGTNLNAMIADEVGFANVKTELPDHPAHINFRSADTTMAKFNNVYTYFGGCLFKNMCKHITLIPKKELLYPKRDEKDLNNKNLPSFNYISTDVLPLAYIFSKYVPKALDYFERAEEMFDRYQQDSDVDVEDIVAPGIVAVNGKKPQLFPHQVKAHQFLRKAPKYAILDVSPGGGKTLIGITDILCLAEKHKADHFVPLVLAPDGLCANWCEDTAKFTNGNWNTIPITTKIVKIWGLDLLTKIIKDAPRNTIIVAGIHFLSKTNTFDLTFGTRKIKISGGVEFLKQFNPNYVLLDESHKAKTFMRSGKTSTIHTVIKEVFTMTGVDYARLATGTLVHGILADVIGQAALMNAYALKTPDEMDKLGINLSAEDGPGKMRTKLGKYCSMITLKRKEWAFMLPNPIDTFIQIRLFDPTDESMNKLGNKLHQEAYEHVINEVKSIILSGDIGKSDDDEDDDDKNSFDDELEENDDEEGGGGGGRGKVVDGSGVINASMLPTIDKKYFQRVEQLITNPWGDSYFKQLAVIAGVKPGDFVPSKVSMVIERLREHFESVKYDANADQTGRIIQWDREMQAKEYDIVEYKGQQYMRRPIPLGPDELPTIKRRLTPKTSTPPDQDLDNWKPELKGKVLIFCRYTGNTKYIFDALPPEYKRKARMFHGQIPEDQRKQNLQDFMKSKDVEIFVANEQAITEGYNLQMASRIIRVDTPWSPGDYEQSTARIFRPDPAAAKITNGKPGDMTREVIYIDWIMTGGTLEVGKVARLMWKTVDSIRFNEKGNSRYEPLNEYVLKPIKMSLDLLFERCELEDYRGTLEEGENGEVRIVNDYFGAKALLANIEASEFTEMRKTTRAEMLDLDIPPIPKDFRTMPQIPTMPNQNIPDPEGFGLVKLSEYIPTRIEEILEDAEAVLKGSPVRTGFGTGTIVGLQRTRKIPDETTGELITDPKRPIHSVRIKYHDRNMLENIPPVLMPINMVYIATKVSGKVYDQFFKPTEMWGTKTEKLQMERAAAKQQAEADRLRAQKEQAAEQRIKQEREDARRQTRERERATIRKDNIEKKRPVNQGVEVVPKVPRVRPTVSVVPAGTISGRVPPKRPAAPAAPAIKPKKIKLIPSFYNGLLCMHVTNNDADADGLLKFGFKNFEDFVYVDFKAFPAYYAFLEWIEDKTGKGQLAIDSPTYNRLVAVYDMFSDKKIDPKQLFNQRHAKKIMNDVQDFFRARLRESKNTKMVKMYPVTMHDRLRIVVDKATNPFAKRLEGKAIPNGGVGGTWKLHPGMHIFFAAGKREFMSKLKELKEAGYVITNQDQLVAKIDDLRM